MSDNYHEEECEEALFQLKIENKQLKNILREMGYEYTDESIEYVVDIGEGSYFSLPKSVVREMYDTKYRFKGNSVDEAFKDGDIDLDTVDGLKLRDHYYNSSFRTDKALINIINHKRGDMQGVKSKVLNFLSPQPHFGYTGYSFLTIRTIPARSWYKNLIRPYAFPFIEGQNDTNEVLSIFSCISSISEIQ